MDFTKHTVDFTKQTEDFTEGINFMVGQNLKVKHISKVIVEGKGSSIAN